MHNPASKIISLQNVGLYYTRRQKMFGRSKFWALHNVTFDLHSGETLGVIGRNGVGKTTLLRVLAGIISPNTGNVILHKKNVRISLLSLQAGFMPALTGRENTILSGMLLGSTKNEVKADMDKIIAFSELNGFIDEPVYSYSDGMRARLGFSIAYYANPDVMLLDEVLGVGDEEFRNKSTEAMKKRIQSDKTAVLVSHSAPLLREVCDRIIWIDGGKSIAQGDVSEVLDAYLKDPGFKKQHITT